MRKASAGCFVGARQKRVIILIGIVLEYNHNKHLTLFSTNHFTGWTNALATKKQKNGDTSKAISSKSFFLISNEGSGPGGARSEPQVHLDPLPAIGFGRLLARRFPSGFTSRGSGIGRLPRRRFMFERRLSVESGFRTDGFADAFECGDALAGDGFEAFPERFRVVGDEFGPITGAAYLDIKRFRRGQLGMVRLHRGNDVIHRAPLKGVHGRGPGTVEMAQLRVAPGQDEPAAFLQGECHPSVPDP